MGIRFVGACLVGLLLGSTPLLAQAIAKKSIDIEAQPLGSALIQLAHQTGIQMIYSTELVQGRTSNRAKGAMDAREALDTVLAQTDLKYEFIDPQTVTLTAIGAGTSASSRTNAGASSSTPQAGERQEGNRGSGTSFRLAQADLGTNAGAAPIAPEPHQSARESPIPLQEIVVTAQKRTERLQDVPLSVTAVSGEEIAAKNVTNLEDLQYSVPGLSMAAFGPGQENIQIRGVSGILGRPTTGQYLDELSVSSDDSNNTLHVSLLDMERVEVLRGPQATLYGEGSMGGTIRYITTPPDLGRMSGLFEADGGDVSHGSASYRSALVANLPLIPDKLGLRLVGGYERDGGWIDNSFTGRSNVNGMNDTTVRAALRALPADHLEVSVLFVRQQNDQDNGNFGINHVSTAVVPTYARDAYSLGTVTLHYDFGAVSLVEAAGFIDHNTQDQFDFTPYLQPILVGALGVTPADIRQIFNPETEWTRSFSNELRLTSNGDTRLRWTVGAFYRTSHMEQTNLVTTAPTTLPFEVLNTPARLQSHSYSLYAEGDYKLTDKLTVVAGGRYYRDTETIDSDQVSFGAPISDHDRATFHSANPRLNVRYEFSPESMAYLNMAEGFRSGGFNVGTPPGPSTFAPDHIWTYELGTKQQLLGRRLEFDGAVYYSEWTDVQSAFFPPGTAGIVVTENAGKATGWGTDLSVSARLLEGLRLTATYGWNNLAFRTSTADKNTGDPVDYSPKRSYSVALDYRHAVSAAATGFLRADYQYAGRAQVTLRDFNEIVPLPARDLLTLRVGLEWASFEGSLYGSNVLNNATPIQIGPYAAIAENVEQRPRTVGLNFRWHF